MANILPYEVSLWEDYHSGDDLTERRIGIIGSSEYKAPVHIFEPKLTTKVNGTTEFEFKICYKYRDEQTGALVDNPWCDYLVNERKIKVKYDNKWYDLVLKDVTKQTKEYIYTCRASDAHVQELARNGFNLEFAPELENNYNNIKELGDAILSGTGWEVSEEKSDNIYQYENEVLYGVTKNMSVDFTWTEIVKNADGSFSEQSHISSMPTENVYIFESSRNVTNGIVSFLYGVPAHIKLDQVNSQQVIKPAIVHQGYYFGNTSQVFTEPADGYKPVPLYANDSNTVIGVVRGERYVHTQQEAYEPVLNRWVRLYKDGQGTKYRSYTDTTYLTPAAVREYVANGYNFTNTSGWRATSWNGDGTDVQPAKVSNVAVELIKDTSLYQTAISAGESWPSIEDTKPAWIKLSVLKLPTTTTPYPVALVNLGVQSQIKQMGAVTKADEFLIGIVADSNLTKNDLILEQADYDAVSNVYSRTSGTCRFTVNPITISQTDLVPDGPNDPNADPKIYWFIVKPNNNYSVEQLTRKDYRWILAITPSGSASTPPAVRAMYMFKKQTTQNGSTYVSPYNWNIVGSFMETRDYWYKSDETSEISSIDEWVYCEAPQSPVPVYHANCAKIRSITAKESNRFNLLQELCEQFQCWMEFNVEHDEIGRIVKKEVSFHNVIGEPNYAGFRYGINEKSIKRSSDSKELVSKLIVKPNSNEFATNGFCTIARSKANPTKDTAIYNFDYYITHGLIDQSELYNSLNKYYKNLYEANTNIENDSTKLIEIATALTDAEAKRQVYEAGLEAADVNITKTQDSLKEMTGYTLADFETNWNRVRVTQKIAGVVKTDDIRTLIGTTDPDIHKLDWDRLPGPVSVEKSEGEYDPINTAEEYYNLPLILYLFSSKARQYVDELRQYVAQHDMYEGQYNAIVAHIDGLKTEQNTLNTNLTEQQISKEKLGFDFYQQWAPFIQEGTFIDESYRNDDQYYYAAQQAGFESAMPKASYTIEVASIGAIPEFEGYTFKLGDQTTIEDVDFFGYMPDGFTPYRESITITEVSNNLDDPSKDKITVKNFSDQFDSLFQRMAATVQQVSYSTGAYEKAAALAEADVPNKLQFLSDALNSAQNVLSNAADQTVKWDNTGITVTNGLAPNEILRMVSGAILLSDNGGVNWTTAITARGISANLITSGQINTNVLQIMNGNQPAFKWDEKGLTAYEVLETNQIDYTAGVRFDRHGLYGFEGAQPDWAPNTVDEIHQNSNFELTKEGLLFSTVGEVGSHPALGTKKTGKWGVYRETSSQPWVITSLKKDQQRTMQFYSIPIKTSDSITITIEATPNMAYGNYIFLNAYPTVASNFNCVEDSFYPKDSFYPTDDTTHSDLLKCDKYYSPNDIYNSPIIIDVKSEDKRGDYYYILVYNKSLSTSNPLTVSYTIPNEVGSTVESCFIPSGRYDNLRVLNQLGQWVLKVNNSFGVNTEGTLYAQNAKISGGFTTNFAGGQVILGNNEYPLQMTMFNGEGGNQSICGFDRAGNLLLNGSTLLSTVSTPREPSPGKQEIDHFTDLIMEELYLTGSTPPSSTAPNGTVKLVGSDIEKLSFWYEAPTNEGYTNPAIYIKADDLPDFYHRDSKIVLSANLTLSYLPSAEVEDIEIQCTLDLKPIKPGQVQYWKAEIEFTSSIQQQIANTLKARLGKTQLTKQDYEDYRLNACQFATTIEAYRYAEDDVQTTTMDYLGTKYVYGESKATSVTTGFENRTALIVKDARDSFKSKLPVFTTDNDDISIGGFLLKPGQSFRIASTEGYYWEIKCSNEEGNVGKLSIDTSRLVNLTSP